MVTDENPDSQKHTLSVLKICNPTPQDSGLYFCQGTNQVGTINSESTFINTTLPPGMYPSLFIILFANGDTFYLSFTLKAKGYVPYINIAFCYLL